jgi:predicted transcriptional regulator
MTTEEIVKELGLKVFTGGGLDARKVNGAYVSDLLSDVMGHSKEGELWITLQSHANVIAIAALKELAAILLVKGIEPESVVVDKAREEGVTLLGSNEDTYSITGKLYQLLNKE